MNKPLLIVIACFFVSCGPLHHVSYKLDAAQLEKLNNGDTLKVTHKRGVAGKQFRLADGGYEEIAVKTEHSAITHLYFYPSGQLKRYESLIYGFKFGKSPLYDENGYLISITDNDAPFKYSISSLNSKITFFYHHDFFKEGTVVTRDIQNGYPIYKVSYPANDLNDNKVRSFVIDGINGKVISDKIITLSEN